MLRHILSLAFILLSTLSFAKQVDTVLVYSPSMNKNIKNVIILPENYGKNKAAKYPVLYLLHGYGGKYDSWLNITRTDLPEVASSYNMIIVCPDGNNSWYWDSPLIKESRYETYITQELVHWVDSIYDTFHSAGKRAITGLSMGGHGALWLAFRHPDIFGATGSMSGGVDIRPFPDNWEIKKHLGEYFTNKDVWEQHTLINQIPYQTPKGRLAIIIDCGTDDFFYEINCQLHRKLLYYKIPHDFTIRPGGHTHDYWKNALNYQLVFFHLFFNK